MYHFAAFCFFVVLISFCLLCLAIWVSAFIKVLTFIYKVIRYLVAIKIIVGRFFIRTFIKVWRKKKPLILIRSFLALRKEMGN
jgi:hypothetical protein